jgi:hypothetical protein
MKTEKRLDPALGVVSTDTTDLVRDPWLYVMIL